VRKALKVVCFDLDGLLVNTEPYYYESTRLVWEKLGAVMEKEYYARNWIIRGTSIEAELEKFGIKADSARVREELRTIFARMVEEKLDLMPCAKEVASLAHDLFTTVLVTNTPREQAERTVARAGLRDYLHHMVTRELYQKAKPNPDCYLAAMRIAGCSSDECLAFEDSPRGVRAAFDAGVTCIAVVHELTRYEPPEGAAMVLDSLAELDLKDVSAKWPLRR